GTKVLAEQDTFNTHKVYFLSGDVISQQVPNTALSPGWPAHLEARDGETLEQTARQLAYVHAYHSARKNCSNPEAKHETWSALASKQSERDWKRFLPDAKLMQELVHPAAPSADTPEPCGGCGEKDPTKACIGCLHFHGSRG